MPEDVKPVGTLKPFSSKDVKPVGKLTPIGGTPVISDFTANEPVKPKPTTDEIISSIKTDNENEKIMLKNLALKVNEGKAKHEDLTDAILTIQGQHQTQGGKKNYYVDSSTGVAIPKPLKENEKAPNNITDVFNETSWYEDLGNSVLRGSEKLGAALAKTPAFIYDVAAIPQNLISEALGGEQVSSETFKQTFGLPENKIAQYYDEQAKINQEKFNQKYDKAITDYVKEGDYSKAFGLLGNSIAESAPTTIGLAVANAGGVGTVQSILGGGAVFGAEKKGELDENAPNMDEQKKIAVALSNGLFEGIFEQFGITKLGGITKDALLKSGKEEAYKLAVDGFKQTYRPVITKYLGTSGEEALSEAATQFAQNAVDKYSGYKPDMNLSDGVIDAALVGFGAGAGYGLLAGKTTEELQKQKINRINEQSKKIFDIVKQGNDAVVGFKSEILNAVGNGKLTKEEGDKAITKINAYKDYNDMLGSLELSDSNKRELFDLSYQKQSLETELGAIKDPKTLNPIEQAQYSVKEKFANDLQKQINEIVLKAQINNETVVSEKTVQDVAKLENPPKKEGEKKPKLTDVQKALIDKYKKDKEITKKEFPEETRSYEQITPEEFLKPNKITGGYRTIHKKAVEFLEKQPNKTMIGQIVERPFEYGGKKNKTYGVELPDGKVLRFSSSMERPEGFRGHMRTEHLVPDEELLGFPIGLKVEEIPALEEGDKPKKVIKAFNANTGKFVGYMKETNTGKKIEYSPKQIDYLEHLGTISESPISPEESNIVTPKTPVPTKPISNKSVQLTKEEYVQQSIKALKQDEDSDYDPYLEESGLYERHFSEQYEKQYGKETTGEKKSETRTDTGIGQKGNTSRKGKKGTPKARRKIKDPRYKKALEIEPNTPQELVMQYFIGGGKINPSAIKELYKNPKQEIQARLNYLNNNAPSIEGVAHHLWQNQDFQRWDDTVIKDAVNDIVNGYVHPTRMAEDLLQAHNEAKFTPNEEAMMKIMDEAEKEGVKNEVEGIIDNLEDKSDDELSSGTDIITGTYDGDEPFQKVSNIKGDTKKVVDHLKKVLPKINIVYDSALKVAGKLSSDGKTISVNPYYAGTDTPIHEGGHVIIDAMGYKNPTIQAAIKQLRNTDLYKETKARYPELNEEMLDKEVLAEAIGREGAGIFDIEIKKNAFQKLLDKIFDWFKNKLGLDKNEAKKLAKSLIRGEFKSVEGTATGTEQFQKNKDKIDELQNDLNSIEEQLNEAEDEDTIAELEQVRDIILEQIETLQNEGEAYAEREKIINNLDIEKATLPELIDAYVTLEQQAQALSEETGEKQYADSQQIKSLKERIGEIINNNQLAYLQKKWGKEIGEIANKRDLKWRDVWFRTMGHITNEFPAIQGLYNEFNKINLAKEKETYSRKTELDRKAKAVIKETNKRLGIKDLASGLITSNSAKYFNYLENNGKLLTPQEAKYKGLSKTQIEYLEAVRELVKEKNKLAGKETDNLEVVKVDKGFREAFKNDGFMTAMSLYMGGGDNLDTPITYTNPITEKTEKTTYKEAQKAILEYSKRGLSEKAIALGKLLSISHKAKKGAYRSDKNINYNGILTSKFDRPYDKVAGYSKDYHAATMQLIDDIAHVKHFNKLVPLANAVELFYQKTGVEEGMQFGNVLEFMRHWKNEQLYQKTLQTDPTIDAVAKFLRSMTSLTVMSFAVPANIMNVAVGNYNSIRKEGWTTWLKGQKELFAGDKHRAGFGFIGKKANDINNKYQIVKSDLDSNPKNHIGKWFEQMAFAGTRFGEYQIQLSLALGLMKEENMLDSFTYKNGELVLKNGVNEVEFEKKINEIKDKVSDIQGKYDPKDRRNIARYELGKAGLQFKNWIPDWLEERFGEEYIDSHGNLHRGSIRVLSSQAIKEMKADIATHGKWMAVFKGDSKAAKNWRSNLNGLLFLTALYIFKNSGDDDDKKRRETLSLQNAFEQVLFVYDPSQAKYLLQSPIASWGIMTKLLDVAEAVIDGNFEKAGKTGKKLIPYNKITEIPKTVETMLGKDKK